MRKEENKYWNKQCNPMYLQGVRRIRKSDSAGPQGFGQPWPDGPDVSKPQRFTKTAVPRLDGTGCWQQHLFEAIMKSNGWPPDTAALQLFGEALQVALLLPDKIRDRWNDLVDKLSAYYKTPGRLAVFRPAGNLKMRTAVRGRTQLPLLRS